MRCQCRVGDRGERDVRNRSRIATDLDSTRVLRRSVQAIWKDPARHEDGASVLLDAGESIKALSEYLGHSDLGFTLRTYTNLLPSSETAPVRQSMTPSWNRRSRSPGQPRAHPCPPHMKRAGSETPPETMETPAHGQTRQ
ncbi:hypothetical protein EHS43_09165 [Streptomyces sp. RP5T]|nr:hypothetical protein EHS43_09165 [Streptomyces sp. RP5T]